MKRGGSMRARSPKRARQEREYRKLRVLFLEIHPRCQFPGDCTAASTEVHHRKGRVGALLLNIDHWSALCHSHHAWTTEHPAAAYEMGISERRIGGAA